MIAIETSRKFFDMMLKRVMNAPINLYFDITPIGRIQKKFGADMESIESSFYMIANQMMQVCFKLVWLVWLIATTLPHLLFAFIPLIFYLFRVVKKVKPAVKRLRFLTN